MWDGSPKFILVSSEIWITSFLFWLQFHVLGPHFVNHCWCIPFCVAGPSDWSNIYGSSLQIRHFISSRITTSNFMILVSLALLCFNLQPLLLWKNLTSYHFLLLYTVMILIDLRISNLTFPHIFAQFRSWSWYLFWLCTSVYKVLCMNDTSIWKLLGLSFYNFALKLYYWQLC